MRLLASLKLVLDTTCLATTANRRITSKLRSKAQIYSPLDFSGLQCSCVRRHDRCTSLLEQQHPCGTNNLRRWPQQQKAHWEWLQAQLRTLSGRRYTTRNIAGKASWPGADLTSPDHPAVRTHSPRDLQRFAQAQAPQSHGRQHLCRDTLPTSHHICKVSRHSPNTAAPNDQRGAEGGPRERGRNPRAPAQDHDTGRGGEGGGKE